MYFVLFFTDGLITKTKHYDTSPEAFSEAEKHADRFDGAGPVFDAIVYEVVDGLPVHIRSY